MSHDYAEALTFVRTEDGLELEGALIRPASVPSRAVVIWIHGGTEKFSNRHYIDIGREVARRGCTFISGNTRGHDLAAVFSKGEDIQVAGSAWERMEEAPLDIAPWVDLATELDAGPIFLAGHSLGASKVVFYGAQRADSRLRGVIAASPVVSFASLPERLVLAQQMVAEGRGEELLPHLVGSPPWNIVSAQTIAGRGPILERAFQAGGERPWIADIRCPILAFYGTNEEEASEQLDVIREAAAGLCETQLIQNADHSYVGRQREVSRQMVGWIDSQLR
jgi:pimeloyl-ACP methyl ester carboxylesterase